MTSITVTSGPKNAHTDPETGLRYYDWQGRRLPSTTSLRRMAGLPFLLHQWAISKVVDRAISEHVVFDLMMNRPQKPRERVRDKNVAKEVGRWLRSAATEERDSAAELGTMVHDYAVRQVPVAQAHPDAQPYLRAFYAWLDWSGATIIATEKQVFNLTVGYAGTFDVLCEFPNGDIAVIDLKTGRGTYAEHALQLVSYALGEFVGEDDVIDQPLTDLLHKANTMALVHLGPDHWKYQRVPATTPMYTAFRGLAAFAVWMAENPDLEHGVVDYEAEGTP